MKRFARIATGVRLGPAPAPLADGQAIQHFSHFCHQAVRREGFLQEPNFFSRISPREPVRIAIRRFFRGVEDGSSLAQSGVS